jgi:hypothetical protein
MFITEGYGVWFHGFPLLEAFLPLALAESPHHELCIANKNVVLQILPADSVNCTEF